MLEKKNKKSNLMENAKIKKYLPNDNDRFDFHADATMPNSML